MKLPRGLSGKKTCKKLEKIGFYIRRQRSSHVIMRRDEPYCQLVIPLHKSLDPGTLASKLDAANLTIEQFEKI